MVVDEVRSALVAARNPDGGWPYYAGKTSRLEPTAWALLALHAAGERVSLDPLLSWPRRDGWVVDRSSDAVNIGFNALAGVVLAALGAPADRVAGLRDALVLAKGEKIPLSSINRQDNSLQGWAWISGTFSWVEPTAWGLLALKKMGTRTPAGLARIAEAEGVLADRVCKNGGWNHGNSNMLGTELPPYVPTSALGLLAFGDRRSDSAATRTLRYLSENRLTERSAMGLGLTRIALGVFGDSAAEVATALRDAWTQTAFLGNLHVSALALYAEAAAPSGHEAFRV